MAKTNEGQRNKDERAKELKFPAPETKGLNTDTNILVPETKPPVPGTFEDKVISEAVREGVHQAIPLMESCIKKRLEVMQNSVKPPIPALGGVLGLPDDPAKLLSKGKRKLVLMNPHSPGDIIMMTAAIRDLHATYPGEYVTDVESPCKEIFEGNPLITKLDRKDPEVVMFKAEYPLIHDSNEGSYHFIHGYRKHLESAIGRPIKQGKMKGDIYIRDEERGWVSAVEEVTKDKRHFWLIDAGYKNDFTAKAWPTERYQAVVDHFKDKIQFVQTGHQDHNHKPLKGVIQMVGQTDLRQLIRLVYHSVGILTPVSMPMVLAAAVPLPLPTKDKQYPPNRACVVISGGREPVQWQMYPNHQFLHTCGTMTCCPSGGCWKSRVQPLNDVDAKNSDLCLLPVRLKSGQSIARCMMNITVTDVVRAIERYYAPEGGIFQYDKVPTMSHEYENRDIIKAKPKEESSPSSTAEQPNCQCPQHIGAAGVAPKIVTPEVAKQTRQKISYDEEGLANAKSVFILEDLPDRAIAYLKKFNGYRICMRDNVQEALEVLKEKTFDLLVLDHDLDGRAYVPVDEPNCGSRIADYLHDINYQGRVVLGSLNEKAAAHMKTLIPQAELWPHYWSFAEIERKTY